MTHDLFWFCLGMAPFVGLTIRLAVWLREERRNKLVAELVAKLREAKRHRLAAQLAAMKAVNDE